MSQVCAELSTEQPQTCVAWEEYVPLFPELSQAAIAEIWLWFFVGLFTAWGGKKIIRLFGA